jgi:hypothetical protein
MLALGLGTDAARAQTTQTAPPAPAEQVTFDLTPTLVTKPKDSAATAGPDPDDIPEAASTTTTTPAPAPAQPDQITSGAGSAQLQLPTKKKEEAAAACGREARALPISSMLGLPGSNGSDESPAWGLLLLAVALASSALALVIWLRRSRRGKSEPRDPLETASTIVALVSAIVGLAVTFVPGIGIGEPPPPEAQMNVREAYARITHGEYADKTGTSAGDAKEDKLEVGNVVWLELQLTGHANKPLRLQYGSYRAGGGGALLPGTTHEINLGRRRGDVETTFLPLWIGYPRRTPGLHQFEAQFRLIDGRGRILQMAATDPMGASRFRYAC